MDKRPEDIKGALQIGRRSFAQTRRTGNIVEACYSEAGRETARLLSSSACSAGYTSKNTRTFTRSITRQWRQRKDKSCQKLDYSWMESCQGQKCCRRWWEVILLSPCPLCGPMEIFLWSNIFKTRPLAISKKIFLYSLTSSILCGWQLNTPWTVASVLWKPAPNRRPLTLNVALFRDGQKTSCEACNWVSTENSKTDLGTTDWHSESVPADILVNTFSNYHVCRSLVMVGFILVRNI